MNILPESNVISIILTHARTATTVRSLKITVGSIGRYEGCLFQQWLLHLLLTYLKISFKVDNSAVDSSFPSPIRWVIWQLSFFVVCLDSRFTAVILHAIAEQFLQQILFKFKEAHLHLKNWFVVQNLKIAESRVFILEAFRLTLFKRIRHSISDGFLTV